MPELKGKTSVHLCYYENEEGAFVKSMKCLVIYFSQTGNTETVAKAIQTGVKKEAGHCDLVKIKGADPRKLGEYDLIGIGSPCFGQEPRNVGNFIDAMESVKEKCAFSFVTHGGNPTLYFPSIVPKLKARGLSVIGTHDTYANCYLLHHVEPYPTKGHPDKIDLKEAEEFGREMVRRSRRFAAGEKDLIVPTPPPLPLPPEIDAVTLIEKFPSMVKYHREKCKYPKCRLCMDNCPMGGIDLSADPPVIANRCHPCEFCARICPTGAIDMDEWCAALSIGSLEVLYPMSLMPLLDKAEAEKVHNNLK